MLGNTEWAQLGAQEWDMNEKVGKIAYDHNGYHDHNEYPDQNDYLDHNDYHGWDVNEKVGRIA